MAVNTDITTEMARIHDAAEVIKSKTVAMGLKKVDTNTNVSTSDTIEVHASALAQIGVKEGGTVELKSSSQTISCAGNYMTSDIVVPAANVYLTGTDTPSDTTGNDGDFFLVL